MSEVLLKVLCNASLWKAYTFRTLMYWRMWLAKSGVSVVQDVFLFVRYTVACGKGVVLSVPGLVCVLVVWRV